MWFSYDSESQLTRAESFNRYLLFEYDEEGLITEVKDHTGRAYTYEYDTDGRLERVISPDLTVGITPHSGLNTQYAYEDATGDLASSLRLRDNLFDITDPALNSMLRLTYQDFDGDGLAEEVSGEAIGWDSLSIEINFDETKAEVTDRRGQVWNYSFNDEDYFTDLQDPLGNQIISRTFSEQGTLTKETFPSGREVEYEFRASDDEYLSNPRAWANVNRRIVKPGAGGTNGSSAELVTDHSGQGTYPGYEPGTNLKMFSTDPRGTARFVKRGAGTGLPELIHEAFLSDDVAVTRIEYNDRGQPVKATDPAGMVTEYEYHEDEGSARLGYLKELRVDPEGLNLTTRYETDELGRVVKVTDPRGISHEYTFNEVDWVVEERLATTTSGAGTPSIGETFRYGFDEAGNSIEIQHSYGNGGMTSQYFEYGDLHELIRIESETNPGGPSVVETRSYDSNLNLTSVDGADGQTTDFYYDVRGLLEQKSLSLGVTETYEYDAEGRMTLRTDPRGKAWRTAYDGYGRVAKVTDPLGNYTTTAYDNNGNAIEVKSFDSGDELLAHGEATYDLLNRPTVQTQHLLDGEGESRTVETSTVYDRAGKTLSTTDPLNHAAVYSYDSAQRLTSVTDTLGNKATYTLDNNGNVLTTAVLELLPGGTTVNSSSTASYDALNRVVEEISPVGQTTTYVRDIRGNITSQIFEGALTTWAYDGLDRQTSVTRPEGISQTFEYDLSSRLLSLTDALGQSTEWSYDLLDRVTGVSFTDSSVSYTWDPAGNLETATYDNGTVVSYGYDDAGRMTTQGALAGAGVGGVTVETFSYDGLGRITSANSGPVNTTRQYDSLSRLISETTGGRPVYYGWDDNSALTSLVYPSGKTMLQSNDSLSRPSNLGWSDPEDSMDILASYTYRGYSLVHTKSVGSLTGYMSYDDAGRQVSSAYLGGSGATFEEDIFWTSRSQRSQQLRLDLNDRGTAYLYDQADRLVESTAIKSEEAIHTALESIPSHWGMEYDSAENLIAQTREQGCDSEQVSMPTDGSGRNRPGMVGNTFLTWDAVGNLAEKGNFAYTFDFKNRLVEVKEFGITLASYAYDAFDRRVSATVGGETIETVWADWQPIEDYRSGVLHSRRVYGLGLDEIVQLELDIDGSGTFSESEIYVPLYDSSGHLAVLNTTDGSVIEKYAYSPFGERWVMVDDTPPVVEQIRQEGGDLWIEFSEEVLLEGVLQAIADNELSLIRQTAEGPVEVTFTASQPVTDGRSAGKRLVLHPIDNFPLVGETVSLHIGPGIFEDSFGNLAEGVVDESFGWAAVALTVSDTAAPEVERVCVTEFGELEVTFSEPVNGASSALLVNGGAVVWTPDASGYTLRTDSLGAGSFNFTVTTAPLDAANNGLAEPFSAVFSVALGVREMVFDAPYPGVLRQSTVGNPYGFHGLRHEVGAGLIFARNRYLDPEMGRFISADPVGYVDGPSLYQYALNNSVNYSDPMGLFEGAEIRQRHYQAAESGISPWYMETALEAGMEALGNPYVQGGLQVVGGCTEAVVGAATLETGFGYLALAHGADLCGTGLSTLILGEAQSSLFEQAATAGFEYAGMTPSQARWATAGVDIGFSLGVNYGILRHTRAAKKAALRGRVLANIKASSRGRQARQSIGNFKKYAEFDRLYELAGQVDVSTGYGRAVFYSGRRGLNRALATSFANRTNRTIIEMTPGGRRFDSLKLFDEGSSVTNTQASFVWDRLSFRYASGSTGEVNAFVAEAWSKGTWNRVELPALRNAGNVHRYVYRGYSQ